MFLVVGLGNPGKEYLLSRHNIGFMVVDNLAERLGCRVEKSGFRSLYGEAFLRGEGEKLLLLKPQTYMNRSGEAVSAAAEYFNILPENIVVVHDELDLPVGALRVKSGGGSAGHKGIKSVISSLGGGDFIRVRVGIGNSPLKSETADYVLSSFSKQEKEAVGDTVSIASDAVLAIIREGAESAMNKFNKKSNDMRPNSEVESL